MEVILKQEIESLGSVNDVVTVKAGYGRNYLIPQGMAILATASNKKVVAEVRKQQAHKLDKMKADATSMMESILKASIKIGAKAGDQGKIFGSVNNIQLADALAKLGHTIDRKHIKLVDGDSIKALGTYKAEIKLHKDVSETIEFEVVEE